jgi:hypothetical protein
MKKAYKKRKETPRKRGPSTGIKSQKKVFKEFKGQLNGIDLLKKHWQINPPQAIIERKDPPQWSGCVFIS